MRKMITKKIKGEPETIYEKILFEALVLSNFPLQECLAAVLRYRHLIKKGIRAEKPLKEDCRRLRLWNAIHGING